MARAATCRPFMPPGSAALVRSGICANRFGSGVNGSFPGSPDTGPGLTAAGIDLIKQANALKMQMDVSHMNEKAFWDTAHHSTSPLVATHSNAHALCPQPRNLTDQQLRAIRDSGGVVGVQFRQCFPARRRPAR